MYAADLSSSTGKHSISACLSKPKTSGVERDPGEKKTVEIPSSWKVSATICPQAWLDFAMLSES